MGTFPGPSIPALERMVTSAVGKHDVHRVIAFSEYLHPLGSHSPEHYAHSLRVGLYAHGVAPFFSADPLRCLLGGCGHDVGKCNVPLGILRSEERLSDAEWERIREHPGQGFLHLRDHDVHSAFVAGLHHRFQPMPYGLSFDAVSENTLHPSLHDSVVLTARVVATCDFYDALTTRADRGDPHDIQRVVSVMRGNFPDCHDAVTWLLRNPLLTEYDNFGPGENPTAEDLAHSLRETDHVL